MTNDMSPEELTRSRDLGAALYLSSYIRLMANELEVTEGFDQDSVNATAGFMVPALNIATEMAFRKLMGDEVGVARSVLRLRAAIEALPAP